MKIALYIIVFIWITFGFFVLWLEHQCTGRPLWDWKSVLPGIAQGLVAGLGITFNF